MILKELMDRNSEYLPPRPGQAEPSSSEENDVLVAMDRVIRQMEAAKRALGLSNRLGDGPSRTKNRSRILGNMNKIRANLRRIEKMLEQ